MSHRINLLRLIAVSKALNPLQTQGDFVGEEI